MEVRSISALSPDERASLFDRDAGVDAVRGDVSEIVARVEEQGDVALRSYTEQFDGVSVGNIDITADVERAYDSIDESVREAIERAAENVRTFHERQLPEDWTEEIDGRILGRRFRPIDRVGVYVPGGTAAYPSSALMGVIPATVAGVEHVSVVTPPGEPINPATLAAIHAAGADAVYQVGGAQAIAALAYGTETVTRVEKIVGPGNKWVTAAKAIVRGDVEIDFLAGPSEILVVADETATPAFVAADLLAQAEHDPESSVVAVTPDEMTAEAIVAAIDRQLERRSRTDTIEAALDHDASGVFLARSMSEAVLFAEEYAAEHLSIQAENDEAILDRIDSAGSVFLGPYTPVAAGDYASGTNHILPTNAGAKRYSGLSVDSFLRSSTIQRLEPESLSSIAETIITLAETEGLEAHAASVRRRLDR